MVNTEAWDRIAARRGAARADGVVRYAPAVADDREFRLCGDVDGKRVLDLGCGSGENAIAFARAGAHVIAVDRSVAQLHLGRKAADEAEVRVEWHESDAADLAYLRADSIHLAFAAGVLGEIEDADRVFRQVHRVLRPGGSFVLSYDHPMALAVGREGGGSGALPLGPLEVRRSYSDPEPVTVVHDDERIAVYPRTVAEVFASLHRAGYRVDVIIEAAAVLDAGQGPEVPAVIIWRARKEGV